MNKLHIMHVLYSLDIGGMENIVVNLVNKLNPMYFSSSICCLGFVGRFEENVAQDRVKIFNLHKRPGHDPFLFLRLGTLFKRENVKIVNTYNWAGFFDGVLGAKIANVPVIIHSEHGKEYEDLDGIKRRRALTYKLILPIIPNAVVTVCEALKNDFIKLTNIKNEKIITIYNGVELEKFNPNIDIKKKKKEIGCNEEDIIIGTVGRLDPIKDYSTLIYAAKSVIEEFSNIKFLFIGDGAEFSKLKNLTHTLNISQNTIFLGSRNDVPQLLKIMYLFVLPSLSEGLSCTILEAMAAKLPVIATNVGGNPEIVINGKSGILFKPKDYHSLAKYIIDLIKNSTKAYDMGKYGFERIKRDFNLSKMISAYESLYMSFFN
jgi:sugar transferase (PEP-CTERM/EpsH1 system associated)